MNIAGGVPMSAATVLADSSALNSQHLSRVTRGIALAVAAVGVFVLLGWLTDNGLLKSVVPGAVTMKANTAVGFVFCGLALWFLTDPVAEPRFANVVAWCILALGLATFGQTLFSVNLAIDELLFNDAAAVNTSSPGRMSPVTAINFALVGVAILLRHKRLGQDWYPAQLLAVVISVLGYVAVLGYALDAQPLYRIKVFTSMAVHTAVCFLVLGVGMLLAYPRRGLMANVTHGIGGALFVRLLPVALFLPALVVWLTEVGVQRGHYDGGFGRALAVTAVSLVLFVLSYRVVHVIAGSESLRKGKDTAEQAHQKLRLAMSTARLATFQWQHETGLITLDSASCASIGFSQAEGDAMRELALFVHPADLPALLAAKASLLSSGTPIHLELRIRNAADLFAYVELSAMPALGDPATLLCSFSDISEKKAAQEQTAALTEKIRSLLDSLPDIVLTFDSTGAIDQLHSPSSPAPRFPIQPWQGMTYADVFPKEISEALDIAMVNAFSEITPQVARCQFDANGTCHYKVTVTALGKSRLRVAKFLAVLNDDTEVQNAQMSLAHMAFHDPLTELPNRRLFEDRLRQAMKNSQRSKEYGAILVIDLDKFKQLNDTKGHEAGDVYLQQVAKTMRGSVRSVDTVARRGGDEFAVILEDLGGDEQVAESRAKEVVAKLSGALRAEFDLGSTRHQSSASIGYAMFSGAMADSVESVIELADASMYAVKKSAHSGTRT
jgi:diguanylate cyclase (GGDEF)-like protein